MYVYLDESGDLGFGEGSTAYFTIAFVVVDNPIHYKRCVRSVKVKHNIPKAVELKGNATRETIKRDLLTRFAKLDAEVHSITVQKRNVDAKLRRDTNILYNYMVGLSLVERILKEPANARVIVSVDRRITSVTSGFKFDQYLKYKVWYEAGRQDIDLEIHHLDSHQSYHVQGTDVICNSIFKRYNSNDSRLSDLIKGKAGSDKRLFFGK